MGLGDFFKGVRDRFKKSKNKEETWSSDTNPLNRKDKITQTPIFVDKKEEVTAESKKEFDGIEQKPREIPAASTVNEEKQQEEQDLRKQKVSNEKEKINKFDLDKIKSKMLDLYPLLGVQVQNTEMNVVSGKNSGVPTACTDGNSVFINKDFMNNLTESEQVFVLAHEFSHIMLKHMYRLKDKNMQVWNIATDGVINQYLQRDGLQMPKGGVDIKDALKYNAESLYEKLLKEKQQDNDSFGKKYGEGPTNHTEWDSSMTQNQAKQQSQENGDMPSSNQQSDEKSNEKGDSSGDKEQEKTEGQNKESDQANVQDNGDVDGKGKPEKKSNGQNGNNGQGNAKTEKDFFDENKKERIKNAKQREKNKVKSNSRSQGNTGDGELIDGISANDKVDGFNWKTLLKRKVYETNEFYTIRRNDNDQLMSRLETMDEEKKFDLQIVLDTSGSVSEELLRTFLGQLNDLFKISRKIEVGCFSDEFYGFTEIKKKKDLEEKFKLKGGHGTNFNEASKAFTKDKNTIKICFTDGQDGGYANIDDKRKDIIWITWENKNFHPDNGKVIYAPEKVIMKKHKTNEFSNI